MFSICEGAFITIAATSTVNDKAGCLTRRVGYALWERGKGGITAFLVISGTMYSLYFGWSWSDYTMTESFRKTRQKSDFGMLQRFSISLDRAPWECNALARHPLPCLLPYLLSHLVCHLLRLSRSPSGVLPGVITSPTVLFPGAHTCGSFAKASAIA